MARDSHNVIYMNTFVSQTGDRGRPNAVVGVGSGQPSFF